MGQSALRAVSLCDPTVVEKLNTRFIPLTLDMPQVGPWSWTDAYDPAASRTPPEEAEKVLTELRATFLDSVSVGNQMTSKRVAGRGFVPAVQVLVLTLRGRLVGGPFMMGDGPASKMQGFIDACGLEIAPGERAARYESGPGARVRPDDLTLRVVARYGSAVTPDDLRRLDNYASNPNTYFMAAFQSAARDWVVLPRARWSRLLPPAGAAPGTRYPLDPEVSASIVLHFLTEDAPFGHRLTEDLVQRVALQGEVVEHGDARMRILVTGSAAVRNPGFVDVGNASRRSVAQLALAGFIDVDVSSGSIRDLQLATIDAAQQPPLGERIPYDAVGYLVPHH